MPDNELGSHKDHASPKSKTKRVQLKARGIIKKVENSVGAGAQVPTNEGPCGKDDSSFLWWFAAALLLTGLVYMIALIHYIVGPD